MSAIRLVGEKWKPRDRTTFEMLLRGYGLGLKAAASHNEDEI